jgi:hypothetical protein
MTTDQKRAAATIRFNNLASVRNATKTAATKAAAKKLTDRINAKADMKRIMKAKYGK